MRANKEDIEKARVELTETINNEIKKLIRNGADESTAIETITKRLTSHIYREKSYGNIPSAEAAKQVQRKMQGKTRESR